MRWRIGTQTHAVSGLTMELQALRSLVNLLHTHVQRVTASTLFVCLLVCASHTAALNDSESPAADTVDTS